MEGTGHMMDGVCDAGDAAAGIEGGVCTGLRGMDQRDPNDQCCWGQC